MFVLPSNKEGFGIVYLEAMLFGVPVVDWPPPEPLDLVRNGIDGLLLDRLDELPEALHVLLTDRARLAAMRMNATDRARLEFCPGRFRSGLFTCLKMRAGSIAEPERRPAMSGRQPALAIDHPRLRTESMATAARCAAVSPALAKRSTAGAGPGLRRSER